MIACAVQAFLWMLPLCKASSYVSPLCLMCITPGPLLSFMVATTRAYRMRLRSFTRSWRQLPSVLIRIGRAFVQASYRGGSRGTQKMILVVIGISLMGCCSLLDLHESCPRTRL